MVNISEKGLLCVMKSKKNLIMKKMLLAIAILLSTIANACEQEVGLPDHNAILASSKEPGLMVFVSLKMPKHSLQQWNHQVTKAGGILVLRGFVNNSMRQTVKKIQEIIGQELQGGFIVDPNKFKQFNVKVVPTVVVVNNENGSTQFDSISGDVGLKAALEKIAVDGECKDQAQDWLQNLCGKS